jgi:pimeloyl-ACP methyl ester carboxylesterase
MTRMFAYLLWSCAAITALAGCTAVKPIRTESPTSTMPATTPLTAPNSDPASFLSCDTGHPTSNENHQIIEDYGNYLIGFAEFDDQGWAYNQDKQLAIIKARVDAEVSAEANTDRDFLVLVFVHGWHHNAHDNDCNVQEFRQMVQIAANGLESGIENGFLKTHRRVIGIYVGWRGESVNADLLRYLTVVDRRNVAERVAKGSVRQLFADLRQAQRSAQDKLVNGKPNPAKMRTVVMGHSFGGLIAFSAVSQAALNDLTDTQNQSPRYCDPSDPRNPSGNRSVWPDATILINPAFEATRYEPFDRLMKARETLTGCVPPVNATHRLVVPHVIVVTSKTDRWTGPVFTAGRSLSTLFDAYDRTDDTATRRERTSNLHAIGFVESYQTHTLDLQPTKSPDPGAPLPKAVATLVLNDKHPIPFETPVWVVTAADDIVHGHDGFLFSRIVKHEQPKPYLANWLLDLYDMDCSAAPQMVDCP